VDAADLAILEGWIEEVELSAQKLTAEVTKLRVFIEKMKQDIRSDGDVNGIR
jgi:hypothetical protein